MRNHKKEVIGKEDKGDNINTEYRSIFDGYETEPVIAYEYNADQMARCINELNPIMYYSMYYDPDDLFHPTADPACVPLSYVIKLFYKDRSQADRDNILGQLAEGIKPSQKRLNKPKKGGKYKSKKVPKVPEFAKLTKYIEGQGDIKRLREIASGYIADSLETMMEGLYESFVIEVLDYSLRGLATEKGEFGLDQPFEDTIKNLIEAYEKNLKKRLGARGPGGNEWKYDFSRFAEYYDDVYHPLWREAKEFYISPEQKNLNPKERFAKVQEMFPQLPEDLIERLDKENVPAYGADPLYFSTPSHIAAEQVGRLCGLPSKRPPSKYSTGYLLGPKVLIKSRKMRKAAQSKNVK